MAGLKRAPDGKAEALFYDSTVQGATLAEGLQKALAEAIARLPIPKVMTYQLETGCDMPGWSSVSFVRPAHGLVAMHGSSVVPVQTLGLKAGNITQGHRFEAAVSPVVLADADSYAATLAKDGAVIASFAERRAEIVRQLAAAAAKVGGGVTPIEDDALLDEVTALVERPNVLICEFEKQFLEVPQECLILTMKANQKYFPLLDANHKLTNKFLVVSSINPTDTSFVVGGNERVVRPRLADAKFFFDQDRKKTLASRVEGLGKVVYHNKLGTQGERVARVRAIAKAIGQQLGGDVLAAKADQAAQLAKTDLVTDMVGEFPELQGTMGRYYALNDGLSTEVAERDRRPLQTALRGRRPPAQYHRRGSSACRQAGNAGRHVRHWQPAHRRQRPVCAAAACAGGGPHVDRTRPGAGPVCAAGWCRTRFRTQDHRRFWPTGRLHLRPPRRQPARAGLQRAGSRRRAGPAPTTPGRCDQALGCGACLLLPCPKPPRWPLPTNGLATS